MNELWTLRDIDNRGDDGEPWETKGTLSELAAYIDGPLLSELNLQPAIGQATQALTDWTITEFLAEPVRLTEDEAEEIAATAITAALPAILEALAQHPPDGLQHLATAARQALAVEAACEAHNLHWQVLTATDPAYADKCRARMARALYAAITTLETAQGKDQPWQ